MPYLICPGCRLRAYSASCQTTTDRCPRCDTPLEGAERANAQLRRWRVADLRTAFERTEADHGAG